MHLSTSPADFLFYGTILTCVWGCFGWGDALWCPPSCLATMVDKGAVVGVCLRTKTHRLPGGTGHVNAVGTTAGARLAAHETVAPPFAPEGEREDGPDHRPPGEASHESTEAMQQHEWEEDLLRHQQEVWEQVRNERAARALRSWEDWVAPPTRQSTRVRMVVQVPQEEEHSVGVFLPHTSVPHGTLIRIEVGSTPEGDTQRRRLDRPMAPSKRQEQRGH